MSYRSQAADEVVIPIWERYAQAVSIEAPVRENLLAEMLKDLTSGCPASDRSTLLATLAQQPTPLARHWLSAFAGLTEVERQEVLPQVWPFLFARFEQIRFRSALVANEPRWDAWISPVVSVLWSEHAHALKALLSHVPPESWPHTHASALSMRRAEDLKALPSSLSSARKSRARA